MKKLIGIACCLAALGGLASMCNPDSDGSDTGSGEAKKSWDPNEIAGSLGVTEKRYVRKGEWMNYTIYFENKKEASGPAQEVFVDLPMDPNLDWTTLELGEIAFGEHVDMGLHGKSQGESSYVLPGVANRSVKTKVVMKKDGVLSWYMRDWDTSTVDNFPAGATDGFLPPNDPDTHCGEGHLSFRVRVKSDAPNGSVVRASAQIVFDDNPMIETDPSWWNTVGTFHDIALDVDGVATNLTLIAGEPFGELPVPETIKTGYTFDAWYTGENGTGLKATPTAIVPEDDFSLYENWAGNPYLVRFDANGGTGTMPDQAFVYGTAQNLSANAFTRKMYAFAGWARSAGGEAEFEDGQSVSNLVSDINGVVTLYAVWELDIPVLWTEVAGSAPAAAASVYDGYLYDAGSGDVKGVLQAKVAKPKNGFATVTVAITPLGGKKVSVKGTLEVATGKVSGMDLTLGEYGMCGTYNGYDIDGSRNLFSSKDKAEQSAADGVLNRLPGTVNIVWEGGTLAVTIAKKGKAKVAGMLADGTTVSVSSQLLIGEDWTCVPVAWTKKSSHLAFALWLLKDGGTMLTVVGLGEGVNVGSPRALKSGAVFSLDTEALCALLGSSAYEMYLPDGLPVKQSGGKWVVADGAKAGKVQLGKDGSVDASKLGANPSALKLTYKAKDGSFKGSFKAYTDVKGKPKATTVNVTGVMVGDEGYGCATMTINKRKVSVQVFIR